MPLKRTNTGAKRDPLARVARKTEREWRAREPKAATVPPDEVRPTRSERRGLLELQRTDGDEKAKRDAEERLRRERDDAREREKVRARRKRPHKHMPAGIQSLHFIASWGPPGVQTGLRPKVNLDLKHGDFKDEYHERVTPDLARDAGPPGGRAALLFELRSRGPLPPLPSTLTVAGFGDAVRATQKGGSPMRALRSCGVAVAVLGLLAAACSSGSTPASGGTPAVSDASTASGSTTQAEQLLTHPTVALVKEAEADHTPTTNEQDLVATYWAFLLNAYTTGTYDPVLLHSGLQDAVVQLASEYPSFFRASGASDSGAPIVYTPYDIVLGQTTFSCSQGCAPSASTLKTIGTDARSAITSALGLVQSSTAASDLATIFDAAQVILDTQSAATSLGTALANLDGPQVLAGIQATASAFLGGAVFATAGTAAAPAAAEVAAIYAGTILATDLVPLLLTMESCQNYQSTNCCIPVTAAANGIACQTPPPTSCINGELAIPQATGVCAMGICTYPTSVTSCPDGQTCQAGVCVPTSDGGADAGTEDAPTGDDAADDGGCPIGTSLMACLGIGLCEPVGSTCCPACVGSNCSDYFCAPNTICLECYENDTCAAPGASCPAE